MRLCASLAGKDAENLNPEDLSLLSCCATEGGVDPPLLVVRALTFHLLLRVLMPETNSNSHYSEVSGQQRGCTTYALLILIKAHPSN